MKLARALSASALFFALLLGFYYMHVTFFRVDVLLYSAIFDGIAATVLSTMTLFILGYFKALNVFEKLQLSVIWLLFGYAFAISLPTVVDRSLSFYILEKLQQRGGGIQLARFKQVFTMEYVDEHRLVDVRLTEQQASGTITIAEGCVQLTERGDRLATFGRFFRKNFLPRRRLLMGSYSDDLTDPFRHSEHALDYACGSSTPAQPLSR